jgi:hypothetical protein
MKERNWIKFKEKTSSLIIRGDNTNEKWNNLSTDIQRIVRECFPEKQNRREYKFTMSQGMLKSKNKKNRLLKKYKRGEIPKETYTKYNKIY